MKGKGRLKGLLTKETTQLARRLVQYAIFLGISVGQNALSKIHELFEPRRIKMPRMKSPGRFAAIYDETISLQRLARQWNVPRREVRRMIQKGKLPFVEIDGHIRIPTANLSPNKPN